MKTRRAFLAWAMSIPMFGFVGRALGMGDGFPNDEDIPATYAANRVVGDAYPQGADRPFQRLTNTRGGGFLTTNSDPAVVGTDPLTGEDAPVGTDVGFSAPIRRFVHTGVLNGDFSQGPPDPDMPIGADNVLPYWVWEPDGDGLTTLAIVADSSYGSGNKAVFTHTGNANSSYLTQMIPVPISQGQQYRALLSGWVTPSATGFIGLTWQFYKVDGTTTIGSESVSDYTAVTQEAKLDVGLVPTAAAFLKLRVRASSVGATSGVLGEVRCAFLPAEATLGLKSISSSTGAISTSETQVVGAYIQPNTFVVGSVYTIRAGATLSDSGGTPRVVTLRCRIGPTTLTGAIITSQNPTTTGTANGDPYTVDVTVTIRSVGASGTAIGMIEMVGKTTQPFAVGHRVEVEASAVTIDTTVANIIELTAVTANASTTTTFRQAYIRCEMAS